MWPLAWWTGRRIQSPGPTGAGVGSGALGTTARRIPSSICGLHGQIGQACPARAPCPQAASQPRTLMIRPRDQHEALQAARQRQTTEECKQAYTRRAGVEGTISQAVRTAGWRRARYMGLAKTPLQNLITAAALHWL